MDNRVLRDGSKYAIYVVVHTVLKMRVHDIVFVLPLRPSLGAVFAARIWLDVDHFLIRLSCRPLLHDSGASVTMRSFSQCPCASMP